MAGLVPAIHVYKTRSASKTWMPGTSGAKTRFTLLPGHDEENESKHYSAAIAHSVVTVFQFRVVAPTDSTFSIAVFDNLV